MARRTPAFARNFVKDLTREAQARERDWQAARAAERERERTIELFSDVTVTGGVVRWNSNGRVPPCDILEAWARAGLDFDYTASMDAQLSELRSFLSEYREA